MGTLCVRVWVAGWERDKKESDSGAQQNYRDISHYLVFFVDTITEAHKLRDLLHKWQLLEYILDILTFADFPPFYHESTVTW